MYIIYDGDIFIFGRSAGANIDEIGSPALATSFLQWPRRTALRSQKAKVF